LGDTAIAIIGTLSGGGARSGTGGLDLAERHGLALLGGLALLRVLAHDPEDARDLALAAIGRAEGCAIGDAAGENASDAHLAAAGGLHRLHDLHHGTRAIGESETRARLLHRRCLMADGLQQPGDAVAVLGRADEHRTDLARPHLFGQVLEDQVLFRLYVLEQLLHQHIVEIGDLLEHRGAGGDFVGLLAIGQGDDLALLGFVVDMRPLERQVDAPGDDAALGHRQLPEHQRHAARRLQHREDVAHGARELVDLVEEDEVRHLARFEIPEDQLQRGDLLGVGFRHHHRHVGAGEDRQALILKLHRAGAIDEAVAVAHELGFGDIDLDAHAVGTGFR
jgi:hypothetical protein